MKKNYINDLVGNTPLVYFPSLSELSGCQIFGKAEYLNPGGSVKDRTALGIILEAESRGVLTSGMCIVEGTAGNTGIGLATVAIQRGYSCEVFMPDNQSQEKYQVLDALGVKINKVPVVPFANQNHFYHQARRAWEVNPVKYFWANQFENLANFEIHFQTTGPEIWHDTEGMIQVFCSAVGTGGTLAGVSSYLKSKSHQIESILVDPMGSGLYQWFTSGEIKSVGSSVTEGIGIMRITENFKKAKIDQAIQVNDQEMISMLYHLANHEGFTVGTSAALNIFAAFKIAMERKNSGQVIVTVICDSGLRYQSKVFNQEWLSEKNLTPQPLSAFFPGLK